MNKGKKILVSGVKPTGRPHIGNYFGAMKQMVDLQDTHDCHLFIADLHALTSVNDASTLSQDTLDLAIDYLAIGLDPKKVTIYKQSDVPQVTELTWIFNCITTMPYLMRAHAFKDAEAKNHEINVGVFDYPLLMASDILLPGANVVPVGFDQKQHLEIARDTAMKFNMKFCQIFSTPNGHEDYPRTLEINEKLDIFKLPEPIIIKDVMTVPGTDGRKMSKSYGNTIGLFATDEEITKAVMKIPTDSKGVDEPKNPDTCNVFALHKLFASESELADIRARYEKGGLGYKESKDILAKNISAFIAPLRERREKIAEEVDNVKKILEAGGKKMYDHAEKRMAEIREKVGLKFK